jgi:D-glycero-D-manno-heptose 1,7-bisphosphate phosphatase
MKKIAFIDRDGVINKKAEEHQYITQVKDFILNDGIFELLRKLSDRGFEIIVLTNQRGIARKIMSEENLSEIHKHMMRMFNENEIKILDIFYCPHDENSCECRKPKPGLILSSTKKYDIDLRVSILISDSDKDVEMGKMAGLLHSVLVPSDRLDIAIKIINNLVL